MMVPDISGLKGLSPSNFEPFLNCVIFLNCATGCKILLEKTEITSQQGNGFHFLQYIMILFYEILNDYLKDVMQNSQKSVC